ncbi:LysR family transcriptional regulator [Bordetella avium]|uniref:LysR-family transcriptional regulator n=1 Tax=Bordetella avium (strain 197N) TaxID=360910 RepID=Q2KU60_BORA1|nr:LysR family transcriptional regulator [Bordetella avium]AZY50519.1 LysR family transcriptional regulator [Bordetella avium]AZY53915.1 LysR family transcriptional regulator [Bordetella avium]RIQ15312.1 LysR family transcriptional regulator [Bordetella avium]RIQ19883.1 LysR family transcriptional regulator [Bordetella avium]RIQ34462.1 LysR family transcriptional regulator [Bordetella avium]
MKRFHFDSTALRYFLTVVETGSVNGAALQLNVVSSAISRQITGLELRLQTKLFERHAKGMRVTEAGRLLAEHARRVESDATRTIAEIDQQHRHQVQTVKISSVHGFASIGLPRLFAAFQNEHPHVRFSLMVQDARQIPEQLRAAQAEIGITYSFGVEKDIAVVHAQPTEIVAVMRNDHPLSLHERLVLSQLPAYPLALPEGGNALRQVLDHAARERQLSLSPVLTSNQTAVLLHYVQAGQAITLCTRSSLDDDLSWQQLAVRPLQDSLLGPGEIQLQTHASRPLSHAAERFLLYLRDAYTAVAGIRTQD